MAKTLSIQIMSALLTRDHQDLLVTIWRPMRKHSTSITRTTHQHISSFFFSINLRRSILISFLYYSFSSPFVVPFLFFFDYASLLFLYINKVSWCSWLSHHLDVVRVPGSNPGETMFFLSSSFMLSFLILCPVIFFSSIILIYTMLYVLSLSLYIG